MKKLFALILFIAPFITQAQVTGLELPYGVKVLDTLATDAWYGPYPDVETALESVLPGARKNRTIKIDTLEYWWRDGNADEDLVVKTSPGGVQIAQVMDSIVNAVDSLKAYTFSNGITESNGSVRLGGTLSTDVTLSGSSQKINLGTGIAPISEFNVGALNGFYLGSPYGTLSMTPISTRLQSENITFSIGVRFNAFSFYEDGTFTVSAGSDPKVQTGKLDARNTTNQLYLGTTRRVIINAVQPATTDRTWTIADEGGDRTFASREYVTTQLMDSITNAIDTLSSGGSTNATAIRGVTVDASAASPSDGDILVYRSAGSDWVLESKPTGGGIEIAQVMDSITNAIDTLVSITQMMDSIQNAIDTLSSGGGGSPDWGDIGGDMGDQEDLIDSLAAKANLAGATFTGKVSFTADATNAGINIGFVSGDPSSTAMGDLWINSANQRIGVASPVSMGATRYFLYTPSSSMVSGRIPIMTPSGQINTDANFTYVSSTLGTPSISVSTGATLPAATSIGDVSSTEIGYVDGVTSAIQTQLNARAIITPTTSTGTAVAFDTNRSYCTSASPCTGNITFNSSGAVVGQMATMIHNDSGAPTFGSEFIILSGEYVTSEDNYIMFFLRESGKVWVTISQEQ